MMASIKLPKNYVEYLDSGSPSDGFTDLEFGGYLILWLPDEIGNLNDEYQINEYVPDFLAFGSNGGGEILAFDFDGAVFAIPDIGMSTKYAINKTNSWPEFTSHIEVDG